jgi:hypothetical protein
MRSPLIFHLLSLQEGRKSYSARTWSFRFPTRTTTSSRPYRLACSSLARKRLHHMSYPPPTGPRDREQASPYQHQQYPPPFPNDSYASSRSNPYYLFRDERDSSKGPSHQQRTDYPYPPPPSHQHHPQYDSSHENGGYRSGSSSSSYNQQQDGPAEHQPAPRAHVRGERGGYLPRATTTERESSAAAPSSLPSASDRDRDGDGRHGSSSRPHESSSRSARPLIVDARHKKGGTGFPPTASSGRDYSRHDSPSSSSRRRDESEEDWIRAREREKIAEREREREESAREKERDRLRAERARVKVEGDYFPSDPRDRHSASKDESRSSRGEGRSREHRDLRVSSSSSLSVVENGTTRLPSRPLARDVRLSFRKLTSACLVLLLQALALVCLSNRLAPDQALLQLAIRPLLALPTLRRPLQLRHR